jgi:hypothetical protein
MAELAPALVEMGVFLGNWMPQGVTTVSKEKVGARREGEHLLNWGQQGRPQQCNQFGHWVCPHSSICTPHNMPLRQAAVRMLVVG